MLLVVAGHLSFSRLDSSVVEEGVTLLAFTAACAEDKASFREPEANRVLPSTSTSSTSSTTTTPTEM